MAVPTEIVVFSSFKDSWT